MDVTRTQIGSGRLDDASFRTLADVSPAGIWRTTAEGQCTYVNRAWLEATGMRDGEWQGEGWADALHPEDAERVFASFGSAVAAGALFRDEWRWLRPDGASPFVLGMGAPEFDHEGRICAYVGINIDISERHQLTQDLEKARERAETAAATKSHFLANMSHELRTPMNGVLGFTDLLLASGLDEKQHRYATLIADSGRAMLALLNDILDISKIEAGQLVIEKVRIDLFQKLRHCVSLVEPNAVAKALDLHVRIDPDVPQFVYGDPLRLRQIMLNLLSNAVKFTERGAVQVAADVVQSGHGERVRIAVSDTGEGIAADKLNLIFDPFSQADGSTARVHGGSGLGLSISRQLAQRMGGTLTVASEPRSGSTFTLDIPLERAPEHRAEPRVEPVADTAAFAGRRVLVAEDHDINQQLIMAICSTMGLHTELASDGVEATMMVLDARDRGTPFDAVLMDVQMPRLDGMEATRRLRLSGVSAAELPILALSANCYPEDVAACIASGMQDHVGKPVERAALAASLLKVWSCAAKPAPVAQPSMADLADRYARLRDEVIVRIAESVSARDATQWRAISADLHKIAGTAAHFGQPEVGAISKRLEHLLITAERDDERTAALCAVLPELRAAA